MIMIRIKIKNIFKLCYMINIVFFKIKKQYHYIQYKYY
jgi:hypothetical protein